MFDNVLIGWKVIWAIGGLSKWRFEQMEIWANWWSTDKTRWESTSGWGLWGLNVGIFNDAGIGWNLKQVNKWESIIGWRWRFLDFNDAGIGLVWNVYICVPGWDVGRTNRKGATDYRQVIPGGNQRCWVNVCLMMWVFTMLSWNCFFKSTRFETDFVKKNDQTLESIYPFTGGH